MKIINNKKIINKIIKDKLENSKIILIKKIMRRIKISNKIIEYYISKLNIINH